MHTVLSLKFLRHLGLRHLRILAVILACITLGILSATLDSTASDSRITAVHNWLLPTLQESTLASDIDTMLREPLFGGEPFVATPEPEEDLLDAAEGDTWRLIGIVTEGSTKHAIIFNETIGKVETAQLGQTLPGGEELLAIGSSEIEINDGNENRTFSLFVDANFQGIAQ